MKRILALLAGLLTGSLILSLLIYYNPFASKSGISPLAVTQQSGLLLRYNAAPAASLLYTDNGEGAAAPHPPRVPDLWEATIRRTRVMVVRLDDGLGQPAGIGIKFSSDSEDTRILNAAVLVDSVWHLYLPQRGTLFVEQQENYWSYIRDIVVPARLRAADNWRGTWLDVMTTGPNALGTARVAGGHGEFAGAEAELVESLRATAYSAETGPAAVDGTLTVAWPQERVSRAGVEP